MSEVGMSGFRWRTSYLAFGAVAFYVAALAIAWSVGANYASESQNEVLSVTAGSLEDSIEDCYSRILAYAANRLVGRLGSARVCSLAEMRSLTDQYGLNEFNVVDSNGVCIASTIARIVGYDYRSEVQTRPYMDLLSARRQIVVQKFRPSVDTPDVRRKYLGLPFSDGSGFIQIGIDEERVASEYDQLFFDYFSLWKDARFCFFIVADKESDRVLEYSHLRNKRVAEGCKLAEIGFADPDKAPSGSVKLFGEACRYQSVTLVGRHFIVVVRDGQYYYVRMLFVLLPAVLLALILACGGWLLSNQRRARIAEARLRAEHHRQEIEERQRQVSDLALARNIQRSSLPSVFPPYPRDLTIDLFADMAPARDVGGDFYDFFYTGPGRLAVLVADVSGKGVPAAMFMMKAKSILRELVLSMGDLGEAVSKANEHLCEGNEADMFVTCWIGIFDEMAGVLRYVNAGHNPPYICRGDNTLMPLRNVSGMFLGGMEGVRYRTFTEPLSPGDLLFLYTDGVTEANNVLGEFFGEERLEEVLTGRRGIGLSRFMRNGSALMSPPMLCRRVRGAVDAFAGKAAQFDDITLLALRYRGRPQTEHLELPAQLDSVPKFSSFAETCLDGFGCSKAAKADLLVALDEITNNVAQYSGSEQMTVTVEMACNPSVVRFSVADDGKPWNPLEHLDPDITLSADEREIGGLGILMVKKLMDDVSYARNHGRNILRFRKQLG